MTAIINKSNDVIESVPLVDRLLALLLLLFFTPVWIVNLIIGLASGRKMIVIDAKEDALGRYVSLYRFAGGLMPRSLYLLTIIFGSLAFVGVTLGRRINDRNLSIITMPPGLVSLFDVHCNVGLCEMSHAEMLIEQQNFSMSQRIKLLLKGAFSHILYSRIGEGSVSVIRIFGIAINNVSMKEAVRWVCSANQQETTQIGYFVNVNSFNIAAGNTQFAKVLQEADRVFADGSGVRLAAAQAGYGLKDNVNGTDMLPLLCTQLARTGQSLYLLGAAPGVADMAAKNLCQTFPGLTVAGTQHGFFEASETDKIVENINRSACSVLLVAMGSPVQEQWLTDHKSDLKVPSALAVGGLFDFYSDNVSRAPRGLRELGLEWVWRLVQEPSRMWRRYLLGNPLFLFRTYFCRKELMK